ncbi:hypothetical protein RB196_34075 [Streptomyces sp. PmtA]|uniref:hypothetical protein n=1 Tax=Streptomyces sp. PmtA TaxID=3074275 RepID=UPI0030157838
MPDSPGPGRPLRLLVTGATPASAADGAPTDNGGGFLVEAQPKDDATVEELARQHAEDVHARTPANKLCTGAWTHAVSTVTFQRATGGTLAWGFKLSHTARTDLGPTVTVSMPYAYVNGKAISPPYGPHTAVNTTAHGPRARSRDSPGFPPPLVRSSGETCGARRRRHPPSSVVPACHDETLTAMVKRLNKLADIRVRQTPVRRDDGAPCPYAHAGRGTRRARFPRRATHRDRPLQSAAAIAPYVRPSRQS